MRIMIADRDLAQPTDMAKRDIYGFVTRNDGDGLPDNNCMTGAEGTERDTDGGRRRRITSLLSEDEEVYHEHGPT